MIDEHKTTIREIEWGSFKVLQDGVEVAGGMGPYADCEREAAHYSLIYGQDGPVKVRLRRLGKRGVG